MPDAAVPDAAAMPDAAVPDAAVPDAAVPDAAVPDAAVPDAAVPDAAVPDAAAPDATAPDAAAPDAAAPDAAAPDAAGALAPIVQRLTFPPQPVAVVGLQIVLVGTASLTVSVTLDLRCGSATTWRPATLLDAVAALPASAAGTASIVRWNSLADLDVHSPQACDLRAVATDPLGRVSPALVVAAPTIDNLREAARRVDHYMIHYGGLSSALTATAWRYQLVILDPHSAGLRRADVATIQLGLDPLDPTDDVIVLCYVSIGEDIRTTWLTNDDLLDDPRFVGDGSGPRVDPRGPGGSGGPLTGLDPLGLPSPGGTGYASYYLDDDDVYRDGVGDGRPDRNANFGGAFVNAGDPAWFTVVQDMQLDGPEQVAGLDEILTTSAGRGLGCDGVFLDTIDTAAPNSYTDLSSFNLSQFEWTAAGFRTFIGRVRATYPGKVILQNRGLFFFDARHPQFALTTGASIDFVLFESFRLDSSSTQEFDATYYPDNRYNVAPKLMAEANRGRGFRVLSLGYAEGPASTMSELTLLDQSTLGLASLLEDIRVAQPETGFRHYLSSSSLTRTNTFVLDHASLVDDAPPVWTSTYNDHAYPAPAGAPTPRVGLQQLLPGVGTLTLRWDVALDLHRVHYVAYVQDHAFDFANDPGLTQATRRVLAPRMGAGYSDGVGPDRFPYEAELTGLTAGVTYHVLVRAVDDAEAPNQDANQHTLTAAPTL